MFSTWKQKNVTTVATIFKEPRDLRAWLPNPMRTALTFSATRAKQVTQQNASWQMFIEEERAHNFLARAELKHSM